MEVPDIKVNLEYWVSPFKPVSDFMGVYAAKMSIPGAEISGCIENRSTFLSASFCMLRHESSRKEKVLYYIYILVEIYIYSKVMYTLRRRFDPGLGPRDENEATNGAGSFFLSRVL